MTSNVINLQVFSFCYLNAFCNNLPRYLHTDDMQCLEAKVSTPVDLFYNRSYKYPYIYEELQCSYNKLPIVPAIQAL